MKIKSVVLMGIALLFATTAFAQDFSRAEVSVVYSYLRFNPAISQTQSRSFNGGGGSFSFNVNQTFALKAEFMGYGTGDFTTTFTRSVNVNPLITPPATIPVGTYHSSGNTFTYLFGPVIKYPTHKMTLFGEILFGGSNTNAYANLSRSIDAGGGTIGVTPTQHPFTMAVGGGLEFNVSHHVALRPFQMDYVLTRYSNPLTSVNNQNNFRYLGGLAFKF